jgi:hypothetical protein
MAAADVARCLQVTMSHGFFAIKETCRTCGGEGKSRQSCNDCGGNGCASLACSVSSCCCVLLLTTRTLARSARSRRRARSKSTSPLVRIVHGCGAVANMRSDLNGARSPGVDNSTNLRLANQGDAGERGGPKGHLWVKIKVCSGALSFSRSAPAARALLVTDALRRRSATTTSSRGAARTSTCRPRSLSPRVRAGPQPPPRRPVRVAAHPSRL